MESGEYVHHVMVIDLVGKHADHRAKPQEK